MNARYKVRRGGRRVVPKEVILQPRPSSSVHKVSFAQELLAIGLALLGIQLKSLSLDILFGGELGAVGVDISNYSSVGESDKGIVDKMAVDRAGVEDLKITVLDARSSEVGVRVSASV